jgi:hypothetical protein
MRALFSSLAFVLGVASCGSPRIDRPFTDSFQRDALGSDYLDTGGHYRLEHGKLVFENAHNHPLWLERRLPDDVRVDLDVTPQSADGDVKVELYGDGKSFESEDAVRRDLQYTDTGYIFIFGGWRNQLSTLVREREHAWQYDSSVPRRNDVRAEPGRSYHWTIFKRGGHLAWFMDGRPFLAWDDPAPLHGEGHDRFCFTGWEAGAAYANLRIAPLGPNDPLTP